MIFDLNPQSRVCVSHHKNHIKPRPMCTRYITPENAAMERHWEIGRKNPLTWWNVHMHPRSTGPFIRSNQGQTELVMGQWALIPWFAKEAKLAYSTVNARSEEVARKASYKQPWAKGQRCIIPAETFDEPCWETGKNVWWRFGRADGQALGLAGLWNTWVDAATGEVVESYTMLTLNADAHPLMNRMHKPDPKLPANGQDKRSVIPLNVSDANQWLHGSLDDAKALVRLAPGDFFAGAPLEVQVGQMGQVGQIKPTGKSENHNLF